jgi:hypothetical protein
MENNNLYIIGYGLSGNFGGIQYEVIQVDNEIEALAYVHQRACDLYETYEGLYGFRTVSQIMEEENIDDEDQALDIYLEERDSWLTYTVEPYSKEYEEEVKDYHYHNPYKEITDN